MVYRIYNRLIAKSLLLALSIGALSACDTIGQAKLNITETKSQAAALSLQARKPAPVLAEDTVRISDQVYLGARSFRARHGSPLPPRLDSITFDSAEPLSLSQIAAELSALFNMSVVIDEEPEGQPPVVSAVSAQPQTPTALPSTELRSLMPPPYSFTPGGISPAPAQAEMMFIDRYRGPASGLLDKVAARFGYAWEHRDNQVVFFRTMTRTFTLIALPNASTSTSTLNSGAQANGDNGSTQFNSTAKQDVEVKSNLTIWTEIKEAVEKMVGQGGSVTLSPSTGTVTVVATAPVMHRVERFIKEQNARLGRQVAISVQVFSVTDFDTEQYGLDVGLMAQELADLGITFIGVTPAISTGASALSVGILESSDSKLAGSEAMIQLLQRQSKVSLVTSSAVTTMSNAVVPVQVNETTSYLAEVSVSETEVGTTTSLTPGQVTTGFNLSLLPQILDDQRITLQFALNLSNLDDLRSVASGGSEIQLPDVSNRAFIQQVLLSSNDTLVLSGFQERRNTVDRSGPVGPGTWFLGGENRGNVEEDYLVVLIAPVVLDAGATSYAMSR